jgi:type VI protein secretion system component Hcp
MECDQQHTSILEMKAVYLAFVALILASPIGFGSISLFMEVENVAGESQDERHLDWIDIIGVSRSGSFSSGGGGTVGRYQPEGIDITMQASAGVTQLATLIATGSQTQIALHVVRSGGAQGDSGTVIQSYIFHDCLVDDLSLSGADGDDIVEAKVHFFYSRMEWETTSVGYEGESVFGGSLDYDHIKNTIDGEGAGSGTGGGGGGTPSTDRDNDDLPNAWETSYGLNPDSSTDRNADPDGDGFSNYLEYIAGTHPKDRTSYLKVTGMTRPDGNTSATLEWSSAAGKSYLVQRSTTGLSNGDWVTLNTAASAGATTSYTLPASASGTVFYRVVVAE